MPFGFGGENGGGTPPRHILVPDTDEAAVDAARGEADAAALRVELESLRMFRVFGKEKKPDGRRIAAKTHFGADEEGLVIAEVEARIVDEVKDCFRSDAARRPEDLFRLRVVVDVGKPFVGLVLGAEGPNEYGAVAVVCDRIAIGRKAGVFARGEATNLARTDVLDPDAPSGIAGAEAGKADEAALWMPARRKGGEAGGGDVRGRWPRISPTLSKSHPADAPGVEEAAEVPPDKV